MTTRVDSLPCGYLVKSSYTVVHSALTTAGKLEEDKAFNGLLWSGGGGGGDIILAAGRGVPSAAVDIAAAGTSLPAHPSPPSPQTAVAKEKQAVTNGSASDTNTATSSPAPAVPYRSGEALPEMEAAQRIADTLFLEKQQREQQRISGETAVTGSPMDGADTKIVAPVALTPLAATTVSGAAAFHHFSPYFSPSSTTLANREAAFARAARTKEEERYFQWLRAPPVPIMSAPSMPSSSSASGRKSSANLGASGAASSPSLFGGTTSASKQATRANNQSLSQHFPVGFMIYGKSKSNVVDLCRSIVRLGQPMAIAEEIAKGRARNLKVVSTAVAPQQSSPAAADAEAPIAESAEVSIKAVTPTEGATSTAAVGSAGGVPFPMAHNQPNGHSSSSSGGGLGVHSSASQHIPPNPFAFPSTPSGQETKTMVKQFCRSLRGAIPIFPEGTSRLRSVVADDLNDSLGVQMAEGLAASQSNAGVTSFPAASASSISPFAGGKKKSAKEKKKIQSEMGRALLLCPFSAIPLQVLLSETGAASSEANGIAGTTDPYSISPGLSDAAAGTPPAALSPPPFSVSSAAATASLSNLAAVSYSQKAINTFMSRLQRFLQLSLQFLMFELREEMLAEVALVQRARDAWEEGAARQHAAGSGGAARRGGNAPFSTPSTASAGNPSSEAEAAAAASAAIETLQLDLMHRLLSALTDAVDWYQMTKTYLLCARDGGNDRFGWEYVLRSAMQLSSVQRHFVTSVWTSASWASIFPSLKRSVRCRESLFLSSAASSPTGRGPAEDGDGDGDDLDDEAGDDDDGGEGSGGRRRAASTKMSHMLQYARWGMRVRPDRDAVLAITAAPASPSGGGGGGGVGDAHNQTQGSAPSLSASHIPQSPQVPLKVTRGDPFFPFSSAAVQRRSTTTKAAAAAANISCYSPEEVSAGRALKSAHLFNATASYFLIRAAVAVDSAGVGGGGLSATVAGGDDATHRSAGAVKNIHVTFVAPPLPPSPLADHQSEQQGISYRYLAVVWRRDVDTNGVAWDGKGVSVRSDTYAFPTAADSTSPSLLHSPQQQKASATMQSQRRTITPSPLQLLWTDNKAAAAVFAFDTRFAAAGGGGDGGGVPSLPSPSVSPPVVSGQGGGGNSHQQQQTMATLSTSRLVLVQYPGWYVVIEGSPTSSRILRREPTFATDGDGRNQRGNTKHNNKGAAGSVNSLSEGAKKGFARAVSAFASLRGGGAASKARGGDGDAIGGGDSAGGAGDDANRSMAVPSSPLSGRWSTLKKSIRSQSMGGSFAVGGGGRREKEVSPTAVAVGGGGDIIDGASPSPSSPAGSIPPPSQSPSPMGTMSPPPFSSHPASSAAVSPRSFSRRHTPFSPSPSRPPPSVGAGDGDGDDRNFSNGGGAASPLGSVPPPSTSPPPTNGGQSEFGDAFSLGGSPMTSPRRGGAGGGEPSNRAPAPSLPPIARKNAAAAASSPSFSTSASSCCSTGLMYTVFDPPDPTSTMAEDFLLATAASGVLGGSSGGKRASSASHQTSSFFGGRQLLSLGRGGGGANQSSSSGGSGAGFPSRSTSLWALPVRPVSLVEWEGAEHGSAAAGARPATPHSSSTSPTRRKSVDYQKRLSSPNKSTAPPSPSAPFPSSSSSPLSYPSSSLPPPPPRSVQLRCSVGSATCALGLRDNTSCAWSGTDHGIVALCYASVVSSPSLTSSSAPSQCVSRSIIPLRMCALGEGVVAAASTSAVDGSAAIAAALPDASVASTITASSIFSGRANTTATTSSAAASSSPFAASLVELVPFRPSVDACGPFATYTRQKAYLQALPQLHKPDDDGAAPDDAYYCFEDDVDGDGANVIRNSNANCDSKSSSSSSSSSAASDEDAAAERAAIRKTKRKLRAQHEMDRQFAERKKQRQQRRRTLQKEILKIVFDGAKRRCGAVAVGDPSTTGDGFSSIAAGGGGKGGSATTAASLSVVSSQQQQSQQQSQQHSLLNLTIVRVPFLVHLHDRIADPYRLLLLGPTSSGKTTVLSWWWDNSISIAQSAAVGGQSFKYSVGAAQKLLYSRIAGGGGVWPTPTQQQTAQSAFSTPPASTGGSLLVSCLVTDLPGTAGPNLIRSHTPNADVIVMLFDYRDAFSLQRLEDDYLPTVCKTASPGTTFVFMGHCENSNRCTVTSFRVQQAIEKGRQLRAAAAAERAQRIMNWLSLRRRRAEERQRREQAALQAYLRARGSVDGSMRRVRPSQQQLNVGYHQASSPSESRGVSFGGVAPRTMNPLPAPSSSAAVAQPSSSAAVAGDDEDEATIAPAVTLPVAAPKRSIFGPTLKFANRGGAGGRGRGAGGGRVSSELLADLFAGKDSAFLRGGPPSAATTIVPSAAAAHSSAQQQQQQGVGAGHNATNANNLISITSAASNANNAVGLLLRSSTSTAAPFQMGSGGNNFDDEDGFEDEDEDVDGQLMADAMFFFAADNVPDEWLVWGVPMADEAVEDERTTLRRNKRRSGGGRSDTAHNGDDSAIDGVLSSTARPSSSSPLLLTRQRSRSLASTRSRNFSMAIATPAFDALLKGVVGGGGGASAGAGAPSLGEYDDDDYDDEEDDEGSESDVSIVNDNDDDDVLASTSRTYADFENLLADDEEDEEDDDDDEAETHRYFSVAKKGAAMVTAARNASSSAAGRGGASAPSSSRGGGGHHHQLASGAAERTVNNYLSALLDQRHFKRMCALYGMRRETFEGLSYAFRAAAARSATEDAAAAGALATLVLGGNEALKASSSSSRPLSPSPPAAIEGGAGVGDGSALASSPPRVAGGGGALYRSQQPLPQISPFASLFPSLFPSAFSPSTSATQQHSQSSSAAAAAASRLLLPHQFLFTFADSERWLKSLLYLLGISNSLQKTISDSVLRDLLVLCRVRADDAAAEAVSTATAAEEKGGKRRTGAGQSAAGAGGGGAVGVNDDDDDDDYADTDDDDEDGAGDGSALRPSSSMGGGGGIGGSGGVNQSLNFESAKVHNKANDSVWFAIKTALFTSKHRRAKAAKGLLRNTTDAMMKPLVKVTDFVDTTVTKTMEMATSVGNAMASSSAASSPLSPSSRPPMASSSSHNSGGGGRSKKSGNDTMRYKARSSSIAEFGEGPRGGGGRTRPRGGVSGGGFFSSSSSQPRRISVVDGTPPNFWEFVFDVQSTLFRRKTILQKGSRAGLHSHVPVERGGPSSSSRRRARRRDVGVVVASAHMKAPLLSAAASGATPLELLQFVANTVAGGSFNLSEDDGDAGGEMMVMMGYGGAVSDGADGVPPSSSASPLGSAAASPSALLQGGIRRRFAKAGIHLNKAQLGDFLASFAAASAASGASAASSFLSSSSSSYTSATASSSLLLSMLLGTDDNALPLAERYIVPIGPQWLFLRWLLAAGGSVGDVVGEAAMGSLAAKGVAHSVADSLMLAGSNTAATNSAAAAAGTVSSMSSAGITSGGGMSTAGSSSTIGGVSSRAEANSSSASSSSSSSSSFLARLAYYLESLDLSIEDFQRLMAALSGGAWAGGDDDGGVGSSSSPQNADISSQTRSNNNNLLIGGGFQRRKSSVGGGCSSSNDLALLGWGFSGDGSSGGAAAFGSDDDGPPRLTISVSVSHSANVVGAAMGGPTVVDAQPPLLPITSGALLRTLTLGNGGSVGGGAESTNKRDGSPSLHPPLPSPKRSSTTGPAAAAQRGGPASSSSTAIAVAVSRNYYGSEKEIAAAKMVRQLLLLGVGGQQQQQPQWNVQRGGGGNGNGIGSADGGRGSSHSSVYAQEHHRSLLLNSFLLVLLGSVVASGGAASASSSRQHASSSLLLANRVRHNQNQLLLHLTVVSSSLSQHHNSSSSSSSSHHHSNNALSALRNAKLAERHITNLLQVAGIRDGPRHSILVPATAGSAAAASLSTAASGKAGGATTNDNKNMSLKATSGEAQPKSTAISAASSSLHHHPAAAAGGSSSSTSLDATSRFLLSLLPFPFSVSAIGASSAASPLSPLPHSSSSSLSLPSAAGALLPPVGSSTSFVHYPSRLMPSSVLGAMTTVASSSDSSGSSQNRSVSSPPASSSSLQRNGATVPSSLSLSVRFAMDDGSLNQWVHAMMTRMVFGGGEGGGGGTVGIDGATSLFSDVLSMCWFNRLLSFGNEFLRHSSQRVTLLDSQQQQQHRLQNNHHSPTSNDGAPQSTQSAVFFLPPPSCGRCGANFNFLSGRFRRKCFGCSVDFCDNCCAQKTTIKQLDASHSYVVKRFKESGRALRPRGGVTGPNMMMGNRQRSEQSGGSSSATFVNPPLAAVVDGRRATSPTPPPSPAERGAAGGAGGGSLGRALAKYETIARQTQEQTRPPPPPQHRRATSVPPPLLLGPSSRGPAADGFADASEPTPPPLSPLSPLLTSSATVPSSSGTPIMMAATTTSATSNRTALAFAALRNIDVLRHCTFEKNYHFLDGLVYLKPKTSWWCVGCAEQRRRAHRGATSNDSRSGGGGADADGDDAGGGDSPRRRAGPGGDADDHDDGNNGVRNRRGNRRRSGSGNTMKTARIQRLESLALAASGATAALLRASNKRSTNHGINSGGGQSSPSAAVSAANRRFGAADMRSVHFSFAAEDEVRIAQEQSHRTDGGGDGSSTAVTAMHSNTRTASSLSTAAGGKRTNKKSSNSNNARNRSVSTFAAATVAQWVSDATASECPLCKRDFTLLFRRRHHCRACGSLCCGDCSTARQVIAGYRAPQRVCRVCEVEGRVVDMQLAGVSSPRGGGRRTSSSSSPNFGGGGGADDDDDEEDEEDDEDDLLSPDFDSDDEDEDDGLPKDLLAKARSPEERRRLRRERRVAEKRRQRAEERKLKRMMAMMSAAGGAVVAGNATTHSPSSSSLYSAEDAAALLLYIGTMPQSTLTNPQLLNLILNSVPLAPAPLKLVSSFESPAEREERLRRAAAGGNNAFNANNSMLSHSSSSVQQNVGGDFLMSNQKMNTNSSDLSAMSSSAAAAVTSYGRMLAVAEEVYASSGWVLGMDTDDDDGSDDQSSDDSSSVGDNNIGDEPFYVSSGFCEDGGSHLRGGGGRKRGISRGMRRQFRVQRRVQMAAEEAFLEALLGGGGGAEYGSGSGAGGAAATSAMPMDIPGLLPFSREVGVSSGGAATGGQPPSQQHSSSSLLAPHRRALPAAAVPPSMAAGGLTPPRTAASAVAAAAAHYSQPPLQWWEMWDSEDDENDLTDRIRSVMDGVGGAYSSPASAPPRMSGKGRGSQQTSATTPAAVSLSPPPPPSIPLAIPSVAVSPSVLKQLVAIPKSEYIVCASGYDSADDEVEDAELVGRRRMATMATLQQQQQKKKHLQGGGGISQDWRDEERGRKEEEEEGEGSTTIVFDASAARRARKEGGLPAAPPPLSPSPSRFAAAAHSSSSPSSTFWGRGGGGGGVGGGDAAPLGDEDDAIFGPDIMLPANAFGV